MKIGFSTLCCPNYDWKEIFSMATDLGFDGIEVRYIKEEEALSPFSMENVAKVRGQARNKGRFSVPRSARSKVSQSREKSATSECGLRTGSSCFIGTK